MFHKIRNKSKDFKEPCYIDSKKNEYEFLKSGLVQIFKKFNSCSEELITENVRIYIDGTPRYDLHGLLKNDIPDRFEDIKTWCENIFEGHNFLILINKAEKWNDLLAQKFSSEFHDINSEIDKTPVHLEATYFIGNSKYTPFGAHIDDISDAFHYNLGPDRREMILWDRETYIKSRGSNAPLQNPENLIEYGNRFPIDCMQKFFLPARNYYHVGVNNSFNISFALAFIKYDIKEYMQQSILMKAKELGIEYKKVENYIEEHIYKGELKAEGLGYDLGRFSIGEAITENVMNLISKGGFREAPFANDNIDDIDEKIKIVRKVPFQAYTLSKGNQIFVFVRGTKIQLPKKSEFLLLINKINSNIELKFGDLIKESELPKEIIWKLISLFYKYNLIELKRNE
ncbi:hypothetical protein [Oceanobacillus massiliensis]|uniref:hypothetical protein n=1 Tax=Oceanobacillus massiliensis TaxID=1465765 RepID=UPI000288D0C7|nr:hypothetical protein [Oceanobacillus massiliensis]